MEALAMPLVASAEGLPVPEVAWYSATARALERACTPLVFTTTLLFGEVIFNGGSNTIQYIALSDRGSSCD